MIEPAKLSDHKGLTRQVQDFWTRNVNAERVQGEVVAVSPRGEDSDFAEREQQGYRSHRHLLPWVTSMQPGRSVLEIGCGVGLDSFAIANNGLGLTAVDLTKHDFTGRESPAGFPCRMPATCRLGTTFSITCTRSACCTTWPIRPEVLARCSGC